MPASGTALSNFNDFMLTTGPVYLTGPDQVINEAVKRTYILKRILRGRGMDETVQSGQKIKDVIMLDDSSTYGHYKPNGQFNWRNPQVTSELSIDWRFSIDHMSWTDQEIELSIPAGLTKEATKTVYKRLKRIKEMRMWTSMLNGMENDLWAAPANQQAQMEAEGGETPYSIPAFITEDTTNYRPTGWTTIMGQAPASEANWRNQVATYDHADPGDTNSGLNGLFNAFDTMFLLLKFETPGTKEEYFTVDRLNKQFVCTSRQGVNLYQDLLRKSNNVLVSKQDPSYNNPQYSGIDVLYVASLDTAALYSGAAEAANKPRYYWINGNFLTPVYHATRYMKKHDPMRHPNQPFTWVQPTDSWWNLFCNSRKRQGIVGPATP